MDFDLLTRSRCGIQNSRQIAAPPNACEKSFRRGYCNDRKSGVCTRVPPFDPLFLNPIILALLDQT